MNNIKFDKDKARKDFFKKNPQFNKNISVRGGSRVYQLKIEDIKKIIKLYPDTPNIIISEMLKIPYNDLTLIITKLRAKKLLPLKKTPTKTDFVDNLIKQLK